MSASRLERFGLHRPELRAWVTYDWANSVFMTSVIQLFQFYFAQVAAANLTRTEASERFYFATAMAGVIVAAMAPVLGALADHAGIKKRMLAAFVVLGTGSTAALALVGRGDWKLGAVLFVLGNIGITGSIVFYESLLPHVASPSEMDRVSTTGYSVGYLAGGLVMALHIWWIQQPALFGFADAASATRYAFVSSAIWWAVFSLPILLKVKEPPAAPDALEGNLFVVAFARLWQTAQRIRRHRDAALMLVAFMLYNDGVVTIIRVAATYGIELGIGIPELMIAILVVQFVGVPCALLFGAVASRIGPRNGVLAALGVYVVICVLGYRMETARGFFALALLVGTVQGGVQGLSRSLFARMVPRQRSSEFFAFYGVFEKFAGIFGPVLFTVIVATTGSSRGAILWLVAFFVIGGGLLTMVDMERGAAAAREAEQP